jgi:xylulokinase
MTTTNLTPAHMARAAMEGVTLGMAYGLRRMESLGLAPAEIRLTGGGSQSTVWRQILADIFGYPVVTMQSAEGAALGAAIQALSQAASVSLGDFAARCSPVNASSRLEPKCADFYAPLLEKQNALRTRIFEME